MKKVPFLLSTAMLSIALFSCQHQPPDIKTDTGPTDTSQISKNLLASIVQLSGTTSKTQTYRYNAQNQLVWYANTSTEKGYVGDTSQIVWSPAGHVSQIIYRSDSSKKFTDPNVDSIIYNVALDATASKYAYKLTQYKMYNTKFKDSSVYSYNALGQISQENDYYFDYKTTKTYIKWATYDYSYNGTGDLINWKTTYFDIDANHSNYTFSIAYTYEDKGVNLLHLGNDAIVIGIPTSYSGHIAKTEVGDYPTDPKWNQNISYTYTYNTKYRPLKASVTDAISGAKSAVTFTYQ